MPRKTERGAIGARLRYDILRRCNFACYYCGIPAAMGLKQLHVDHVIPVDLGGTNDPWNLVAACWDCNAGKTNGAPTPELVRQVRDDYALYVSPVGNVLVDPCRYCGFPSLVDLDEDEEPQGQCSTCNEHMCDANADGFRSGWDRGYARGVEEFVDYIRKGGGHVVQG